MNNIHDDDHDNNNTAIKKTKNAISHNENCSADINDNNGVSFQCSKSNCFQCSSVNEIVVLPIMTRKKAVVVTKCEPKRMENGMQIAQDEKDTMKHHFMQHV